MIEAPESQSINPPPINNQSSQFASQVNDPNVYETMQQVIKKSKEKITYDNKKEEDEEEDKGEDKEEFLGKSRLSQSMIQRRINFLKLNKEFKNIFNKDNSNINDKRRCLIHTIIFVGVLNCCAWEIDCLFFNVCYGEDIEMKKWVSISLFPLIGLSIFLLYILNTSINYLKRTLMMICINIYLALSIFAIMLGIYSIVKACELKTEDVEVEKNYKKLSPFEQEYYGNRDNLRNKFKQKMLGTGIIDLILGAAGVIIFLMTLLFSSYLSKTNFDWRPPLRSHIRFPRIKKAIQLYTQNYDSFLNVFRAENPNYQFDEIEAKENINRFGALAKSNLFDRKADKTEKESDKESYIGKSRKKKKEKSEKSSDKDDDYIPKIKKKKNVFKRTIQNNSSLVNYKDEENNKKSEDNNNTHVNNNNINNHINENEDNTGINNTNNKKKIVIEEINTDIKENNKEEI